MASLSVPLHLLQNRMHNQYQSQNASNAVSATNILDAPPAYDPVTLTNLKNQIGLVQNFFLAKLHANNDDPLVEDEDLPQKQRFPKPRLPPSGKISSPRKRPLKEQGGNKSKKKKMDNSTSIAPPVLGKLKLAMPNSLMERTDSNRGSEGDKDNESGGGLMSPESMEIMAA
jgi:transcriptional activator SPT7